MSKAMLTVREASQRLGLQEGTLRLWLAQRRLPYVKLGRAVRIPADAVEQYINANTIPAREAKNGRH